MNCDEQDVKQRRVAWMSLAHQQPIAMVLQAFLGFRSKLFDALRGGSELHEEFIIHLNGLLSSALSLFSSTELHHGCLLGACHCELFLPERRKMPRIRSCSSLPKWAIMLWYCSCRPHQAIKTFINGLKQEERFKKRELK